jgi:hypothetical protein
MLTASVGKTTLLADLAARHTRAGHEVLFVAYPEALRDELLPRFKVAGGTLDRLKVIRIDHKNEKGRYPWIDDITKLTAAVSDPESMVIVDPLFGTGRSSLTCRKRIDQLTAWAAAHNVWLICSAAICPEWAAQNILPHALFNIAARGGERFQLSHGHAAAHFEIVDRRGVAAIQWEAAAK